MSRFLCGHVFESYQRIQLWLVWQKCLAVWVVLFYFLIVMNATLAIYTLIHGAGSGTAVKHAIIKLRS